MKLTATIESEQELNRRRFQKLIHCGIADIGSKIYEMIVLLKMKLRKLPSFVPELDFVAEVGSKIVSHAIYSLAKVMMPDDQESDLSDPKAARAIAKWYTVLHQKGRLKKRDLKIEIIRYPSLYP